MNSVHSDGTKEAGVEQAPWDPTSKWNSEEGHKKVDHSQISKSLAGRGQSAECVRTRLIWPKELHPAGYQVPSR